MLNYQMKKKLKHLILILHFIMLLSAPELYAESTRDIKILEDITYLEKLFPCGENSENEKKIYSFIEERLDSLGISYYTESLDMLPDIHSFSSNIIAQFKGKKDKSLIISVPVNNLKDSSFNIAQILSLAEELENNPPEVNCTLIFLGAEYSSDGNPDYPVGSRQFLNTFFPENDTAVIYLDLVPYSKIDIIHGSREVVTPLWLLRQIIDSLTESGEEFRINTQENILYQMGYDTPTPADIYLNNSIPSVSLLSSEEKKQNSSRLESITGLRMFLENLSGNIDIKSPENWDRHYFMMNAAGENIIADEYSFIIIYIISTGLLIAFSVISGKKVLRYAGKLFKYFWVLIYFFILIFLFLLISTFITVMITDIKSSYDIWKESPFFLLILKISITTLLFFLSLFLLKKIKLPVSGSFYSAAAIFVFLINLMIFQFMNVSLSLFAVWGLIWTMLFSLFKSRLIKTLCMLLSSVFIIYIVFYTFSKPAYNICETILFDKLKGNILTSFVILPYIMMIIRILISRTHIESAKYRALRRTIYSGTALLIIFLLNFYIKNNPFPPGNMQPVSYSQTTDINRNETVINITSPYRTGNISFFSGNNDYSINSDKTEYMVSEKSDRQLLTVNKKSSSFLDRKNIILEIQAEGFPENFYIDFFTKDDPVILDCNYPFTLFKNINKGTLHIGKNPPSPLIIDMLLPEDTSIWFRIRAVSETFPFDNKLKGNNKVFKQKFEIIKSTDG